MERLFRWTIILLLCLFIIGTALPVMASGGGIAHAYLHSHVKDDIGLFTVKDIERMNRALANHHYKLYVVTASGYNEVAGMKLADQVYDELGLGYDDLLLLITTNPNFVHIAFENEQLAFRIMSSRARSVRGVTDTQFVPYAKNGDVAGGVIAVSEYINGLGAVPSENASITDESTGKDNIIAAPITSDMSHTSEQQNNNLHHKRQLVLQIGAVILIVLVLASVLLVLRRLSTRRKLLRRRTAIQRQINKMEHRLAVLLGSDALNVNLPTDGSSKDKSMLQSQLRQDGEQQLQQLQQCRIAVRTVRLRLLSLSRPRLELGRLEHELLLIDEQLIPLEQQHALLDGTVPAEAAVPTNLVATTTHTTAIDSDTILPSLQTYDPAQTYDLDAIAAELEAFIAREGLYVGRADHPLVLLEQARTDQQRMRKLQARGDRSGAAAAERTLDSHVHKAQRLVEDMLRFRTYAMQLSEQAERTLEEYELLPDWYAREWERLEGHYTELHLAQQRKRYEEMNDLLQRIDRLCPQIVHNLLSAAPDYRRAYEDGMQISMAIQRLQEQRLALLSYAEELDLRKKLNMERWEALSSHHRDIASRLSEQQLDHLQISPFQEQSFQSLEHARLLLLQQPVDLYAAEQSLELSEQHLEQLIRQFETAERSIRAAQPDGEQPSGSTAEESVENEQHDMPLDQRKLDEHK
ncbi:TPM domain-containing protein [Paenibacillus campi]|uniref:TPM domain-containing protein n=1 Tax=Paenibacillus campi TaxID=3106031 RepID=UPI002AFEAA57|nr:hypothetical protein [Paenibacillus sp. SGZ-1014]